MRCKTVSDQMQGSLLFSQTVSALITVNCVLLYFHETFVSDFHANLQKVTKTSLHSLGSLGDGTCPDVVLTFNVILKKNIWSKYPLTFIARQ